MTKIDLSTCFSGQKVRFANGKTGELASDPRCSGHIKMLRVRTDNNGWWWCSLDGIPCNEVWGPGWEIVEILSLETKQPVPTPQEMDYKTAYLDIAMTVSVAFPECEVTTVDMVRLIMHENRALRMALGLPSYKQVSDAIDDGEME